MEQPQNCPVVLENAFINRSKCAVYIRDLTKSYHNGPPTLKHLNMTVNQGTIYGLLGSSGCGKTTLLSCIVGLHTWNSGNIFVFGQHPGKQLDRKIGYMPQDLSLYHQLTTYEIIQFYGKLYTLSMIQLEEKWKLLKTLLQLPPKSKLIEDMSGGEQRRASLALALVHSPELLILDEPTVGLDPLLREKIWKYLHTIVNTMNTTIILSTHYTEEARFCNMTGVLRNGQIIAEWDPTSLLQEYDCSLLEDAVLKLCQDNEQQGANQVPSKLVTTTFGNSLHNKTESSDSATALSFRMVEVLDRETIGSSEQDASKSMETPKVWCPKIHYSFEKVSGLTLVMALTLIRHPLFLAMCMIMPTVQCCFTLATLGYRVKNLHFGVVNYDIPSWEAECVPQNSMQNWCDLKSISCGFINKLQEDDLLILNSYNNETAAIQGAQAGEIWGYFVFPANFSAHLIDFAAEKRFALNETLEGSRIHFRVDHSQYLTAFFIVKGVYNTFFDFANQIAGTCGLSGKELLLPFNYRPAVHGDYTDSYAEFIFPGTIIWALGCSPVLLSALIFVTDYKQGTLQRARIAGLNIYDIIFSHLIIQSTITLLQLGIVTGIVYLMFGYAIKGFATQLTYLVTCLVTGGTAISFGRLLGIAFRDEAEVLVFCLSTVPFYLLWGGVFLPTETTTWLWQQFGYIIPIKIPIAALRSVLIRGLDVANILVWSGILSAVLWTLVFSVACIVVFKALRI